MIVPILFLLLLCASGAYAQGTGVDYVAAAELRTNLAGASQTQKRLVGKVPRGGEYRYMTIRRDRTPGPGSRRMG